MQTILEAIIKESQSSGQLSNQQMPEELTHLLFIAARGAVYGKYNAEDILNQLKDLCIENLKSSEMGGQRSALTKHTEFKCVVPISILAFFSFYIFTKKLKLRK